MITNFNFFYSKINENTQNSVEDILISLRNANYNWDDSREWEEIVHEYKEKYPQYVSEIDAALVQWQQEDDAMTAHMKQLTPEERDSKMQELGISNFKMKSGSEGPRHDPYGYNEISFTKDNKQILIHMGLAQYIEINGQRIEATGDDYDNSS